MARKTTAQRLARKLRSEAVSNAELKERAILLLTIIRAEANARGEDGDDLVSRVVDDDGQPLLGPRPTLH